MPSPTVQGQEIASRVQWVDCARGWCIVLVVMMHAALGVGVAIGETGWLHEVVAFAKPFRMPDFFVVAGLFAARAIEAPWRRFLDRKVVHFLYFYVLWLLVALLVKAHGLGVDTPRAFADMVLWRLVQPFSTTWFIQLLPILYLTARATRRVPTPLLLSGGLALHYAAALYPKGGAYAMESQATGWITADGFLLFAIYFLIGVRCRAFCFALAEQAARRPLAALAALLAWGVFETVATRRLWPEIYGFDLPFGLLGAAAVIVASAVLARHRIAAGLAALGRRSLIVYLAFFLPMATSRVMLLRLAPDLDIGLTSLLVTIAAVAGPLVMERLLRATPLRVLFERPRWARIAPTPASRGAVPVVAASLPR